MLLNIKNNYSFLCPNCHKELAFKTKSDTNINVEGDLFCNVSEIENEIIGVHDNFISMSFILGGNCHFCHNNYYALQNNFTNLKTKKAIQFLSFNENENQYIKNENNQLFFHNEKIIETVSTYKTINGLLFSFLSPLMKDINDVKEAYEETIHDKLKHIIDFKKYISLADFISDSIFSEEEIMSILFPIDNVFIQTECEDLTEVLPTSLTYLSFICYIFQNSRIIKHNKSKDQQFFYYTFNIPFNDIKNLLDDNSPLKKESLSELTLHIPYLKNKEYEEEILNTFKNIIKKSDLIQPKEIKIVDYKDAEIYYQSYIKNSSIVEEIEGYYLYRFNNTYFYLNDDWSIAIEGI